VQASIEHAIHALDGVSTALTGTLLKVTSGEVASQFVKEMGNSRAALVATLDQVGKAPGSELAKSAIGTLLVAIGTVGLHKVHISGEHKPVADSLASAAARFDSVVRTLERLSTPKIIDLTPNWKRARYKDLVREKAGADWFELTPEQRRQRAHDLGAEIGKEYADFEVTGAVFEKLIEPTLFQPTFVTHLPKELVPLAKLSPEDPTTVEVFECCINGQEISPGYTEQNDPIEQRERLEHQAGGEQQKLDEDFLTALEHGMPPAGGIGIGIDRLCMMLLGQESIRDVILFPQLKPK
jgi:aspartyl/asparaginyl-tRNA synthetase